jgi:acetyl-CoA acetyltransferase family protein
MNDILILGGARTPYATWAGGTTSAGVKGGALRELDSFDLGAAALKGALAKTGVDGATLDRVTFGYAYQVSAHFVYGTRYVTLRAGLPETIPSFSVALACGTGLYSVIAAAQEVEAGRAGLIASGGADCVSQVRRDVFVPSFKDLSCGAHIAQTAQDLAKEYGFTRADQDKWSWRSHERAMKAKSIFAEEIVPVTTPAGITASEDDFVRQPTEQYFAESKLLFEEDQGATHANTHAIVDGASALIMGAPARVAGKKVLGRYIGGEIAAVPPRKMGVSSAYAIRKLLEKHKLAIKDIDLFEVNETFASQAIVCVKELGLPEEKVNVNGGAIALGHPFAGTGPRLVFTLLSELKRRGLKRGIASICVGAGHGVAVLVETV